MNRLLLTLLLAFSWAVESSGGGSSAALAWTQSSSPMVVTNGIYYGVASGVYTNRTLIAATTAYTVSNLVAGVTYFFAATALDSLGNESPYSNEASYMPPLGPRPAVLHAPKLPPWLRPIQEALEDDW